MPTKYHEQSKLFLHLIDNHGRVTILPIEKALDPVDIIQDTASEISNSLNSVNEKFEFTANIFMSPVWYNILASAGFTKDIPNNWLKMHGMAMRRRRKNNGKMHFQKV